MEQYVTKRYIQPGFTLVEVMIAMLIALIIMGGVYRTLQDETVNQDRSEKILDMQNNARVALDRIARDVRRTGSLGCGGRSSTATATPPITTIQHSIVTDTHIAPAATTDTAFVQDSTLHLADDSGSVLARMEATAIGGTDVNFLCEVMGFSNNNNTGNDLYQDETDAITLIYLTEERAVNPDSPMASGVDDIRLMSKGFDPTDILYITDCDSFALFKPTGIATGGTFPAVDPPGKPTVEAVQHTDLGKNYGQEISARVSRLKTATYYLNDFTLYLDGPGRPLASNIEDLQFEFLADEDGDGDLTDDVWRSDFFGYPNGAKDVRAVRIWVLAMSEPDFGYTDQWHIDQVTSTQTPNYYNYPNSPYCDPNLAATELAKCRGTGTPASKAPIASPADGEHRHRYLASTVVYLRNAGLK